MCTNKCVRCVQMCSVCTNVLDVYKYVRFVWCVSMCLRFFSKLPAWRSMWILWASKRPYDRAVSLAFDCEEVIWLLSSPLALNIFVRLNGQYLQLVSTVTHSHHFMTEHSKNKRQGRITRCECFESADNVTCDFWRCKPALSLNHATCDAVDHIDLLTSTNHQESPKCELLLINQLNDRAQIRFSSKDFVHNHWVMGETKAVHRLVVFVQHFLQRSLVFSDTLFELTQSLWQNGNEQCFVSGIVWLANCTHRNENRVNAALHASWPVLLVVCLCTVCVYEFTCMIQHIVKFDIKLKSAFLCSKTVI